MPYTARPLIEEGEFTYIIYDWYAMRLDPTTNNYTGSVARPANPQGGKIMPTFSNVRAKVAGADSESITVHDGADVSLSFVSDDDSIMQILTGATRNQTGSGTGFQSDWTLAPGINLPYMGIIVLGLTLGSAQLGGYCVMAAPKVKIESLGEGVASAQEPELPVREMTGRALSTNINGGATYFAYRKRGYGDEVNNFTPPTDATTFKALFGDSGVTVLGAPTALALTAGSALFSAAWTAPSPSTGLLHYFLRYRLSSSTNEADWVQLTVVDNSMTRVTGLSSTTEYTVQVAAVTVNGQSVWSTAVNVTTT